MADFFKRPGCQIDEIDIHQAELEYDVMQRLVEGLVTVDSLTAISFSKNDLGIDDALETSNSDISDGS